MQRFLARVTPVGGDLFLVEQVSRPTDPGFGGGIGAGADPGYDRPAWGPADPGFGNRPPTDPGYGRPGWSPTDPGYGHGGAGLRPGNALPVPPPSGVVSPPIYLPERPHLPAGAGVVVPLPEGATVPAPKGDAPAPPAGTKPHILWYGPGTKPSIVYLQPAAPAAPDAPAPEPKKA